MLACGRRFGKTQLGIDRIIRPALRGEPAAWFAPNSKLFDEVWDEFLRLLKPVIRRVDSQKNRITLITDGRVDFWTLHNTDDPGRGRKYATVFIDEAAIAPRLGEQWQAAIRPTLTDLRGTAWFASTPKGQNFFYELFRFAETRADWMAWQLATAANPHLPVDEIDAARVDMADAYFRQEYLAEFLHEFGAIFKAPTFYDPSGLPRDNYREATGADFAYTHRAGDWTVFIEGRHRDDVTYVTRLFRRQVDSVAWAKELQSFPRPLAFIGGQEKGIAEFLRRDYGIKLRTENATQDKKARAMPVATAWNRGEIRLPAHSPIASEISRECMTFTGEPGVDEHDDVVDALAALHHAFVGRRRGTYATWKEAMGTQ